MIKYKRICKFISIAIAILLAFVVSCFLTIDGVACLEIVKSNYSTQEDYAQLKEYAVTYVKTLDDESIPKNVNITQTFEKNNIIITLDNGISKIDAKYPVKMELQGEGKILVNISCEEGVFTEYSDNESKHVYIAYMLLFFLFVAFIIYWIGYLVIFHIGKIIIKKVSRKQ